MSSTPDMRMRALYERHGRALYRYLLGLSYGQPQLAEDLVQQTLLRAWRNIELLNSDATVLTPWLFTVARRVAIDAARAAASDPLAQRDVGRRRRPHLGRPDPRCAGINES